MQAVKHRERIGDQHRELTKIAGELRTAVSALPAESIDFCRLADSLMNLRNVWSQGELAGTSRFVGILHSDANEKRTALEKSVKEETRRLTESIDRNAPFYDRDRLTQRVWDVANDALACRGPFRKGN